MNLFLFLLMGALAGWLAGFVVRGYGFGLVGNMLLGVVGAIVGGFVLPLAGVKAGPPGFLTAFVGAVLLLFVANWLRKRG